MKNVYKFLLTSILAVCFALYGVAQAPLANAGTDKTICKDQASYTLSEASASGYTTITWTRSGTGTFTDASVEKATYNPSNADKTAGFVNLTITAVKTGWATPTTDFMVLNFANAPDANAGLDASFCKSGTSYTLAATASNYQTITWTSTGTGTFTNAAVEDAVYYPSANDKTLASVNLTMTLVPNSPCVGTDSDFMVLSFVGAPDADAGLDASFCKSSTSYTLAATASNYQTITWTTSGTGTFTNAAVEDAVYFPSANDKTLASVNLTMTLVPNSPCVGNDSDFMVLSFVGAPDADAGLDASFCKTSTSYTLAATASNYQTITWTSTGTGTFTNAAVEDAVYFPSANDKTLASVNLTMTLVPNSPCVGTDSDFMVLSFINSPDAAAGSDATICTTQSSYTLAATASGYSTITWTSTGTGTFTNAAVEDAVYFPSASDKTAGSVILTMTLVPNSPCVGNDSDEMTLTFQAIPTVNAGADATTCEDTPYTISDATVTAGLYTAVTWTTSGNGTFDDTGILTPEYTPGSSDADGQGVVTLTLSAVPLTPCFVAVTDFMTLNVKQTPDVNAGADQSICETGVTLTGTVNHALSTLWTTYGDGTFANENLLSTVYTPGTADKTAASVKISLVAAPIAPCTLMESDDLYLTVSTFLPTVNAGADNTGCSNEPYSLSSASVTNYLHVLWIRFNADGTFSDEHIVNPTYSFGPNDITRGYAELKLVAEPISPCLQLVEDGIKLYVQNAASANVGPDKTICEDATYTFTSPYPPVSGTDVWASYVEYVSWSTSGTGTFTYPDTYCKPTGGEFLGADGFNYFKLGEIDNTTGHATNGYAKYMNLSTGLLANSSYTVTWRCGYVTGALASLWIDLNMNGTFEDSERLITNASISNSNTTQNFTVPSGATPGEKRLRIRMRFAATGNNSSNPCSNFTYGETEDYTVFIVGANGNVVPPTYDPSAADVTAGSVNLTMTGRAISPCTINAVDYMVLNLQKLPVANAGADQTICENQTYTVSDATAANYSTLTWTTDGDGSFSGNPLTITYNPGANDISGGSATLTLTLQPINPCTATDDDTMDLTIQLKPTVDLGVDDTVCEDETSITLNGTIDGGPYDDLLWTHDGAGSIAADDQNPTSYTVAAGDAGNTVEFTLTVNCTSPCTGSVQDSYNVEFQELPEITSIGTGANATYCEDATAIPLNSTVTGLYDEVEWTTDGLGDIADASALNTTYDASADDGNETVTFTLTVTPSSPCETTVDDEFSVYIQKLPVVDAGVNGTVCEDGTYTLEDASADDYQTVTWITTLGDGEFDFSTSAINPDYTPGNGDIVAGSVVLQIVAGPISPCSTGDDDSMTLYIQKLPVANAGSDATICADGTYTVSDASAENELSVSWTEDGTGSLSDETTLSPTYTPGDGESGNVKLTLTAEPTDPCTSSDDDFMTLTIRPLPELTVVDLQATKTSPISWFDASGDIDNGYSLCIDGIATTNYNLDVKSLTSTPMMKDGIYNEFFHSVTPTPDFLNYWAAKGVVDGATGWQGVMWEIINGREPIFYLLLENVKAPVGDYKLIDGLKKQYASVDEPLTLPGDYPQGDYTFTGTVQDINGCVSDEISISLEFVHAPIISAGSDATIANNQSYTVDDASAEHYTSITWSHDGNGDLTGDDGLTPTYDADATDGGNIVTLTMYADGTSPCVQTWDEMTITVKYAPVVTITYPDADAKLYAYDVTFAGTAVDNDGSVVNVEVNVNDEGWVLATDINPWSYLYTLNPGSNTIKVRATDDEGYVSDEVERTVYLHIQEIPLTVGWQLISSFLDPLTPTTIPTIMSPVVANLVTMNTVPSGIYAPAPFNINTIGNWDVNKGYKVKMKATDQLNIAGDPLNDNDPSYTTGFYYLPVLTDQIVSITDIFDPLGSILYIQDLYNIYWPAGGLTTWNELVPGRAYYAQFTNAINVDFPDYQGYLVDEAMQAPVAPIGPWAVNRTLNTHIISIDQKALVEFAPGFIGAFDALGNCIGFTEIGQADGNVGLLVYGDDEWTEVKDGATEGELINFRYYNNSDQSEIDVTAEFDNTKPQYDGKYTVAGLSMIKSFYKTSTGIGEVTTTSIQVYPNPAKDEITISYNGKALISEVTITTTEGNIVRTLKLNGLTTTINISDLAAGVYFMQFNTESGNKFTKLVVQ